MSFFENAKKPEGLGGKIMVAMMNSGHGKLADWGMSFLSLSTDAAVLDCGCGGGANLRKLLKRRPNGTVTGIDYSSVRVEKSKRLKAKAISEGRCCVLEVSYLSDWRTDLGGKKNFHNSTGDTYDCISLMSYYTVCKAVTKLILHWSFAAKEYINETFTF